jgi:prepilin-type N-terminal cleavage/methylation domain-containing protein
MKERSLGREGFTLVEIIVVLSLLAVIAVFAMIGFRNYAHFQQYNQAVSEVTFILNQVHLRARSAEQDTDHGIKFSTTGVTEFVGSTYVAGDPDNVVTNFNNVSIQHDLSGGTDEIIFAKLTGLPSATGTVTVEGVDFAASTTLEVTGAGVIQ